MVMDNYSYLVTDCKNQKSVLIDPGDTYAVQKVLQMKNIEPDAILVTHKHWDHSGGNRDLKRFFPNIPVYGSYLDNVPDSTHLFGDGEILTFGDLKFKTIFTPGHTIGHAVFLLDGSGLGIDDSLFSGDCLFLGGCGRMFEAPPLVMLNSLDRLLKLDDKTLIWPGHEYAQDNLKFAKHIDPNNYTLQCPSTISEEKSCNPFLKASDIEILRGVGMINIGDIENLSYEDRARALSLIREHKDLFNYKL
ncbi:hypothetical protein Btru_027147 [Bulinus truncatus]|nr:hypothetical protein Btru_027147 [Bulinus truncatus]